MRTLKVGGLAKLVISLSVIALPTGCASWPAPVKIAATPFAAVRDVIDIPLASTATFFNNQAEGSRNDLGDTNSMGGYGWSGGHGGFFLGFGMNLTYPVGKALAYTIGGVDYLFCRSLVGSASGISPLKSDYEDWRDFLFPNISELRRKESTDTDEEPSS